MKNLFLFLLILASPQLMACPVVDGKIARSMEHHEFRETWIILTSDTYDSCDLKTLKVLETSLTAQMKKYLQDKTDLYSESMKTNKTITKEVSHQAEFKVLELGAARALRNEVRALIQMKEAKK